MNDLSKTPFPNKYTLMNRPDNLLFSPPPFLSTVLNFFLKETAYILDATRSRDIT